MPDRQRLLELALKGLEAERANIDDEIAQIKSQLNPRPTVAKSVTTASPITPPKKENNERRCEKKDFGSHEAEICGDKEGGRTQPRGLSGPQVGVGWSEAKFWQKAKWRPFDRYWPKEAL